MQEWLDYFEIEGINWPAMSKQRNRLCLNDCLHRYKVADLIS